MAAQQTTCETYDDILKLKTVPPDRDSHGVPFKPDSDEYKLVQDVTASNRRDTLFYNAVRYLLKNQFAFPGTLPEKSTLSSTHPNRDLLKAITDDDQRANFLAAAGLMLADGFSDPLTGRTAAQLGSGDIKLPQTPGSISEDDVFVSARFIGQMVEAVKEYKTYAALFLKVYLRLREVGAQGANSTIGARQLGEVTRQLVSERADPNDPQLKVRVDRAISSSLSGSSGGPPASIDIDLPELEDGAEADVLKPNVEALSAVYFAAMLEELKFFSVAEKVVEQFMTGAIPLTRGSGGQALYRYFKDAPQRLTESDRRGLYARSFGVAQGSVDEALPNREFSDLWIRFLSAVSFFGRELTSTERKLSTTQQVFKSARDLAVNLSLHGYAIAHFAAVELQGQVRTVKDMLSDVEVLAAFGVRDCWQLIERVSIMYLGGSVNSVRQRTMAQSGARIIQWLADRAPSLSGAGRVLEVDQDVTSQVERWLAVTGTPDDTVQKFMEPISIQTQPTIPDILPQSGMTDSLRQALQKVSSLSPQMAALPQA
jgi:hypothetical protein